MRTSLLWCGAMLGGMLLTANVSAQQMEAEDYIVNREVCTENRVSQDKWDIWSTDPNKKAWSGGTVVRSPIVRKNRETTEEGAPMLHFRLPVPEPGKYSVTMTGSERPIGVSLDGGKTWRRMTSGIVAEAFAVQGPAFEVWFDDRYASDTNPGSAYIDFFTVARALDPVKGVSNGDFEYGKPGERPVGWSLFTRDRQGTATVVEGGHESAKACRIQCPEGRDWDMKNTYVAPVKGGDSLVIRGWLKVAKGHGVRLEAIGYWHGERKLWSIGRSRIISPSNKWQKSRGIVEVPQNIDGVMLRVIGNSDADVLVDDITIESAPQETLYPQQPLVNGFAKERVVEKFDRSVVAQPVEDGVYISWRLLKEDGPAAAFDIWRLSGGQETKLNSEPLTQTCDWLDTAPVDGAVYIVRGGVKEGRAEVLPKVENGLSYKVFKLSNPEARVQKVAVCDLNGDGVFDYVVKHPSENIDPWSVVWYKSPDTYKIEAFLSDGTRLWTNDLGWDIERGIWYSPYVAYDLNGDGKAEVAAKIGAGDHREEDGHVYTGDEFFVVWDGMTGKEIARAPWPKREMFGQEGQDAYHFACRNLMAVGYLDGRTPALICLRGTYGDMVAEAWQLNGNRLERLWSYNNDNLPGRWQGQGAHTNYCVDVDGDGRDEVILGSAVIDDNGMPLWSTGKGHPDGVFYGKIIPGRPGHEIGYFMETRNTTGGLCVADAATGKLLWELDRPTQHIDGKDTCADIDPLYPGVEMAGADMQILEPGTNKRGLKIGYLFTADGQKLMEDEKMPLRFGQWTAYWDADLQKELVRGRVCDYQGGFVSQQTHGGLLEVADVLGDWREEIICSPVKGEFRIYTTDIPAMDRRPCLMQEHNYRMRILANSMGYPTEALLPYDPESESPNLNLTCKNSSAMVQVQVVAVASRKAPLKGTLVLSGKGMVCMPDRIDIDLQPGERVVKIVTVESAEEMGTAKSIGKLVKAVLNREGAAPLRGQVPVRIPLKMLSGGIIVEAEAFAEQKGGEVQLREDKIGTRGKSLSHWDSVGHTLGWTVNVPADGEYKLVVRYCNPDGALRRLEVDGKDYGEFTLYGTGGFGSEGADWEHFTPIRNGVPVLFKLQAGSHVIRMENRDGKGCNLDYLGLVKTNK